MKTNSNTTESERTKQNTNSSYRNIINKIRTNQTYLTNLTKPNTTQTEPTTKTDHPNQSHTDLTSWKFNHSLSPAHLPDRSEVEVRALAEDHGRVYTCEAANGLGITVNNTLLLDVIRKYTNLFLFIVPPTISFPYLLYHLYFPFSSLLWFFFSSLSRLPQFSSPLRVTQSYSLLWYCFRLTRLSLPIGFPVHCSLPSSPTKPSATRHAGPAIQSLTSHRTTREIHTMSDFPHFCQQRWMGGWVRVMGW